MSSLRLARLRRSPPAKSSRPRPSGSGARSAARRGSRDAQENCRFFARGIAWPSSPLWQLSAPTMPLVRCAGLSARVFSGFYAWLRAIPSRQSRRSGRSRPKARQPAGGPAPLVSDAGCASACARDARPAPWPAAGLPLCAPGSVHTRTGPSRQDGQHGAGHAGWSYLPKHPAGTESRPVTRQQPRGY